MSPIRRPRNRQSLTPRQSCTVLPLLAKRLILSFSLQNRSLREESRQEAVKVETQTAPDAEKGWSRRRRASRQSSDGVRHIFTLVGYLNLTICLGQWCTTCGPRATSGPRLVLMWPATSSKKIDISEPSTVNHECSKPHQLTTIFNFTSLGSSF